MAEGRDQSKRILAIYTPLGEDVVLLDSITGTESLGRLFSYELQLVSNEKAVDYKKILGENISVRLQLDTDRARFINGFVSRFSRTGMSRGLTTYSATIVPWLWFLTRTSDCRIYQEMSIPDVVKDVFDRHGFSDYELNLSGTYRTWEYIAQYRETDFNFVSRLLEQEGIYYYFKHEDGAHKLVLCDSVTAHDATPAGEIPFFPPQDGEASRGPHIWGWQTEQSVQPGAFSLTDYNFTNSAAGMLVKSVRTRDHAGSAFELFDYPGEYGAYGEGESYADVRADELQTRHETVVSTGNVRDLALGHTFDIKDEMNYLDPSQVSRNYLLTDLSVMISEPEDFESSSEEPFEVSLVAIPSDQPYRPSRSTPKPIVQGPQTAVVCGPSGEEIHTDEYGRIKVHFHWDRHGKLDENASCWIRVAQSISGKQWGALVTPRIGQEVVVEFLEGDPDRPIVTGAVYNDANMPPYPPNEMPTISCFKSNASKGGGGFNEFRIEDKKGEEQIFIHGEKNLDIRVKNDRYETVLNDRHLMVHNDKLEHVKRDRHETIDRDHIEHVDRDRHVTVNGKECIAVTKTHSTTVADDVIEVYKKNQSTEVTKDCFIKAENICLEASKNITIKVGKSHIAIESSGIKIGTTGKIVQDAVGDIQHTSKAGVTVKGLKISNDAQTQAEFKGGAQVSIKGPMAEVKGDAMLVLKGGIVMIN